MIVLKLSPHARFSEVYNGDFPVELRRRKSASKRRVVSLRINELKKMKPAQVLTQKNSLAELTRLFLP